MTARLLLCAVLIPALAFAQEPEETHTLTVSGTGTVERAPDRARIRLAVESFAPTAAEASAANAQSMEAVLDALRRTGVPDERIRTVSVQLTPEYDHSRDTSPRRQGEDRLVGFRARNMVEVTLDDLDRIGPATDAAIGAGANRVDQLSFELRDPDAARREALGEAVASAHAEADAVARAMGRTLGPAITASTTGALPSPAQPQMAARAMADFAEAAIPPPVQPGQLRIQATVTIVYRLATPQ